MAHHAVALRLTMRAVATLSIEPTAGGLRFRLDVPEQDLGEPLQEEYRQAVDEATLRALVVGADALLRLPERPTFADDAARAATCSTARWCRRGSARACASCAPRCSSRRRSPACRGSCCTTTRSSGVCATRWASGSSSTAPCPRPGRDTCGGRPRALIVAADPRDDLPFARREADVVCEALEPHADVTCVAGHVATFDTVSRLLGEGFDLIHFCGHVVTAADGTPALLLAGEQPLSASLIEANVTGRPLVVLNGCASARGDDGDPAHDWEATVSSVAHGFLFGGAAAVVGTLSDVGDRHAATLAEAFYRRVLEPMPIGEALRAARVACRDDRESAGSPTWLSFVLYGNPSQVLLRGAPAAPTPIRPPAAEPEVVTPPPVPAPAAVPPRRRTWIVAALLVLAAFLAAGVTQMLRPRQPTSMVVGVMEVKGRGAPHWMRELTRDGLNTILSKFAPIKVFSRQKIDFVREKRGVSEIEAAEALGMQKMLMATVSLDRGEVLLELEVIDIQTGLLEGWERVQGPESQLMALQTDLAVRALRLLGLEPTPAQVESILASRGNETLNAYRMLTDTLGEPTPEAPAVPAPPTDGGGDRAPGTSWLRLGARRLGARARPGRGRHPRAARPLRHGARVEERRQARRAAGRDDGRAADVAAALLRPGRRPAREESSTSTS